mgnify:CR=1 FL=1
MPPTVIPVDGMSCEGCSGSIDTVVGKLDFVTSVKADHIAKNVTVEGDHGLEQTGEVNLLPPRRRQTSQEMHV